MDQQPAKPLHFVGRSRHDLRAFPKRARESAGYGLECVQRGNTPSTVEPMTTVGRGCWEIIADEDDGWFRVFYVIKCGTVYVLLAFKKKTNKTPQSVIDLGKKRYSIAEDLAKVKMMEMKKEST